VETPLLFPVINPSIQLVEPRRLKEVFGFEAVITNAYILKNALTIDQSARGYIDF